jgi:hypothetical protein
MNQERKIFIRKARKATKKNKEREKKEEGKRYERFWAFYMSIAILNEKNFLPYSEIERELDYSRYSEKDDVYKGNSYAPILSNYPSPEENLIRKETYLLLSSDAKYVMGILCDNECLELLCPSKKDVSRRLLYHFLRRRKEWENKRIEKTFKELDKTFSFDWV